MGFPSRNSKEVPDGFFNLPTAPRINFNESIIVRSKKWDLLIENFKGKKLSIMAAIIPVFTTCYPKATLTILKEVVIPWRFPFKKARSR
jgi:hypothetical protein